MSDETLAIVQQKSNVNEFVNVTPLHLEQVDDHGQDLYRHGETPLEVTTASSTWESKKRGSEIEP